MLGWPISPPATAPIGTSAAMKHPPAYTGLGCGGLVTMLPDALMLSCLLHIGTPPVPPVNICPEMAFA